MNERERLLFCATVWTMPIRQADAIVLLSGDGVTRVEPTVQLYGAQAAPRIIVSGGVDRPPYSVHAKSLRAKVIEAGAHPDNVLVEDQSQHTWDQAVQVGALCKAHDWTHLLLVTSTYHAPRAFLTFLRACPGFKLTVAPGGWRFPWWGKPDGMAKTRLELLEDEFDKIDQYTDHVATYEEGLEYLRCWGQ